MGERLPALILFIVYIAYYSTYFLIQPICIFFKVKEPISTISIAEFK